MNLFTQPVNSHDAILIDSLIDENIEEFLYELVTGETKPQPNVNVEQNDVNVEQKEPQLQKKNTGRQYIRLPDARLHKYQHKSWLGEIKRDNATSNKKRRRNDDHYQTGNSNKKRRFSDN